MRHHFGKFRAALAVFGKFQCRREQRRVARDERVLLVLDQFGRNGMTVVFGQRGFVIEQVQLARRASHEKINDALCLGQEMRRFGRERVDTLRRSSRAKNLVLAEQRSECDGTEANATVAKEMAAPEQLFGFDLQFLVEVQSGNFHTHHSFVIVSSMFSSTREASVHAATLCKFTSGVGFFSSGDATSMAAVVRSSKYFSFSSTTARRCFNSNSSGFRPVHKRNA